MDDVPIELLVAKDMASFIRNKYSLRAEAHRLKSGEITSMVHSAIFITFDHNRKIQITLRKRNHTHLSLVFKAAINGSFVKSAKDLNKRTGGKLPCLAKYSTRRVFDLMEMDSIDKIQSAIDSVVGEFSKYVSTLLQTQHTNNIDRPIAP
jgi:hypothetical protein